MWTDCWHVLWKATRVYKHICERNVTRLPIATQTSSLLSHSTGCFKYSALTGSILLLGRHIHTRRLANASSFRASTSSPSMIHHQQQQQSKKVCQSRLQPSSHALVCPSFLWSNYTSSEDKNKPTKCTNYFWIIYYWSITPTCFGPSVEAIIREFEILESYKAIVLIC